MSAKRLQVLYTVRQICGLSLRQASLYASVFTVFTLTDNTDA
jgi:hypothetical protein